jgi:hypothetical protein
MISYIVNNLDQGLKAQGSYLHCHALKQNNNPPSFGLGHSLTQKIILHTKGQVQQQLSKLHSF